MIFTNYFFIIVAKALPSIITDLSPREITRISAIIFIYAGVLSLNTLYIQSIGSGIGIYSGLFQISHLSLLIQYFLFNIASLRLMIFLYLKQFFIMVTNLLLDALLNIKDINNKYPNLKLYLIKILTYIIVSLIFIKILIYLFYIYTQLQYLNNIVYMLQNVIPDGIKNDNVPSDPVRWWPSGVPQGMSVVGTALATYLALSKIAGLNPRFRVLGALASAGVSSTHIMYNSALENSVGFNRLMWGLTEYRRTNSWPSIEQVAKSTSEKQINDFAHEAIKQADNSKVESTVNEVLGKNFTFGSNSDSDSNFSDLINNFIDLIFKEAMQLLKPEYVQGYFDDLIGQRMAIELILYLMCLFIIILFIIFICNVIFLLNKDRIIKRFDNKFITLYVKYQTIVAWFTLLYLPIFICIGLFTLSHGLHWLITNQIPYDCLGINLHKYLSISNDTENLNIALLLSLNSNKINISSSNFRSRWSTSMMTNINIFYYSSLCLRRCFNRGFSVNRFNYSNSAISNPKLNKELRKVIGGGYMSYKNVVSLGNLIELMDNKAVFLNQLEKYLDNLENNKTYTLLPVIRWIDEDTGLSKSITISDSIKITKFVDINLIAERLSASMISNLFRYEVGNCNTELVLMNRVWLDISEFNVKEDEFSIITNTIDKFLSNKKSNINIDDLIMKRLTINDKYNNIIMNNYGEPIIINGLLTGYKINNNQYIIVKKGNNDTNYITVKNFNLSDENLITWTDTKTDFGFIRNKNCINFFFNNNGYIFKTEGNYNFLDYPADKLDYKQDNKIGSIDFETFGNEGIGIQNVYAGGWAINDSNKTNKFYYIEKDENSLDVVKNIITDLANNIDINGYTFYAHNLGRFDSVFLIKACILLEDIDINPKWKDNKILSITIYNKKNKCKFKVLDSIQMINGTLDSLFKSFEIKHKKGHFPHNFINKDRLFYIGETPDHKYYKNMPIKLYNSIKTNNWNLKSEALKYLEKDVVGLLELMTNFNDKIYNLYSLNITKFVTAPKLAVAIYTSNFYNKSNDLKIKMIRGNVEKEIRSAYFGGNVNVLINKMNKGFYYDMNSQYPYAMLNDMPIGNPTLSTDKDLNNYFGFVYGEITPPDSNKLRVPYIQMRDEKSGEVSCPRGTFSRMIFSEEIKEAITDGYTIKVQYGYKFERGKDLFKNYVSTMYNIKKNSKDPVEKALSKLFLNSLYGKFGMKDITSTMKIVNQIDSNKITSNYNYSLFADLGNGKVLIKYSSKIHESLRKLLKDFDSQVINNNDNSLSRNRGVPSAVQISAAISAYARMSINKYKNIPGNPCIMSDTDSVVLSKELPSNIIGTDIGKMKLEHTIEEGIFIRKKLYALKTINNQVIIKSSGVKPSSLNYDKFKLLLSGESVKTEGLTFNVIWNDLNINIVNKTIKLQGLQSNLIDIIDHYDINFKSIVPYNPYKTFPSLSSNQNINNIDNIEIIDGKGNIPYIKYIKYQIFRLFKSIYKHIIEFYKNIYNKYS